MILCVLTACASRPRQNTQPIDNDYVLALAAANEFLEAWRSRDQERGLAVLSPRLRKSKDEEFLRFDISGISNPHHESYEVTNGRRLPDGRYAFDVWLWEYYTAGQAGDPTTEKPLPYRVIVVKTGLETWQVDDMPASSQ